MDAISIKMPAALLKESGRRARALGIPRAEYIRQAIERMNGEVAAQARAARLDTRQSDTPALRPGLEFF